MNFGEVLFLQILSRDLTYLRIFEILLVRCDFLFERAHGVTGLMYIVGCRLWLRS